MNGNRICRPIDIMNYCEFAGITLTIRERMLFLQMKSWAGSVIYELENKDEGD